jgi:PAS domain S-box-containing protein
MMNSQSEDKFPLKYLLVFLVITVVITVIAYFFYMDRKNEIEKELYRHVVSIKEIKLQQISKEQLQRKLIIDSFLQLPEINDDLNNLLTKPSDKQNVNNISKWAKELNRDFDFVSVNIFNKNADLLFTTDTSENVMQNFLKQELRVILHKDSSSLTNLYIGDNKNLLQAIISPVKRSGEIIGYIWTEVSFFEYLYPILTYTKRESDDVEYIILKSESDLGFILRDIKEGINYKLNILPLDKSSKTELEKVIFQKEYNLKPSLNDQKIIASVNKVPGTDWYLIAKINQDKIVESTRNTALVVLIISILLIILAASVTYAIWKRSRLYFITRTINLRKEKEALSERYTSLTKYANDMILSLDKDGFILEANQKAFDTYGYQKKDLLNMNLLDLSVDRKKDIEIIFSSINTDNGILFETNHKRKNGTIIPVEISAKLIKLGDEEILLAIVRDNTERKKLELDLILAKDRAEEMDRLKTIFLSNMSHELNTPMSGIIGFSELLLQEIQDKNQKDMAAFIHKSSKRLNDTLTSLLDISKLESKKMNVEFFPIEIVSILKSCKSRYSEAAISKGLIINLNLELDKVYVNADATIITKIFYNLIDNAIKYTNRGEILLTLSAVDSTLIIKVIDGGIGISEDQLDLIFEPFRQASEGLTRKYEGSGLGLSITKKYVEILGGKINIKSKIDMGTSVTLEFPISKK